MPTDKFITSGEWTCPDCGSTDPHHGLMLTDHMEMDVTCSGVYFTFPTKPIDGFYLTHGEFEAAIDHYEAAPEREDDR